MANGRGRNRLMAPLANRRRARNRKEALAPRQGNIRPAANTGLFLRPSCARRGAGADHRDWRRL